MKYLFVLVVLAGLFLHGEVARGDDMPPLYVELWLPYVAVGLPVFPPCDCIPGDPVCVCSR